MAPIDPSLRIRSVALGVADLERSADFYERVLGLAPIAREERTAQLGREPEGPVLTLEEIESPSPLPVMSSGLYHVAWLHPSRADLAETVHRIAAAHWPFEGAADHGVSEALYLSDPDGLGIEVYVDRPREMWERPAGGRGVSMVTLPLDLEDLMAQSTAPPSPAMAPGAGIGHVHMKVSDVARAAAFYRDALGFEDQATLPSAAFLSAGGYHHHVGLNSWQSRGAPRPPASAPSLRRLDFELSGREALDAFERGLPDPPASRGPDGSLAFEDPDGQLLRFSAR